MIAWIGLGGNLGNVATRMRLALNGLEVAGCHVQAVSGLYCTAPIGPQDQPDFLNAVARLVTRMKPLDLLDLLKELEPRLGRMPRASWREREIDLDLLLARESGWLEVNHPRLQLPHPRYTERGFVVQPLLELDPELKDPGSGRPVRELGNEKKIGRQDVRLSKVEFEWRHLI